MDFVLIGRDGTDAEAPARRAQARAAHLALGEVMRERGELRHAAALLDAQGAMCGSVMVLSMPSREALDAWLAEEPYLLQKVWASYELHAASIGPAFRELA